MGKIKEKKSLYIISIIILVSTVIMEIVIMKIVHFNWMDSKYYIFRVLQEFSYMFICILIFEDPSIYTKVEEEIQLNPVYIRLQKIIAGITIILCLVNSLIMEIKRFDFWNGGINIILAGAIAQYSNYFIRRKSFKIRKKIAVSGIVIVVIIFLYGVLYQWGKEIFELLSLGKQL